MGDPANGNGSSPEDAVDGTARYYKRDFWGTESLKFSKPHHRLSKSARVINKLARGRARTLLDIGCGPATLEDLVSPNIQYHGIDIAIHEPAPNLVEADLLETPIAVDGKRFDIIIAQGFFEYAGEFQDQKFSEISRLLNENGLFVVSYVNFDHRKKMLYWPYNNVQSFADFRESLLRHFKVDRYLPTSYNWNHTEPNRKLVRAANMHVNINIPVIGRRLAVEYFFVCSRRDAGGAEAQRAPGRIG